MSRHSKIGEPQPTAPPQAPRTPRTLVDGLVTQALAHRSVHHPFLRAFGEGHFGARTGEVARTFAHWYAGYSAWFPHYLEAVIARLDRPDHRRLLAENLAEERGRLAPDELETVRELGIDPATVDGVPHPELFRRFCRALGLGEAELMAPPPATLEWRAAFRAMLKAGSAAYGVGALGLGTETIVSSIYPHVLRGLERVPGLSREDAVFFELHCHVDDQHHKDLLAIAADLARDREGALDLERGMRDALELRDAFWDQLHAACPARPALES